MTRETQNQRRTRILDKLSKAVNESILEIQSQDAELTKVLMKLYLDVDRKKRSLVLVEDE